jgi:hypothetical protein
MLTELDIIRDRTNTGNNHLKFLKSGLSGYNTVTVIHSTKWDYGSSELTPQSEFYYDIDFYNPSSQAVTLKIKKPYDTIKYSWAHSNDGYFGMKDYCLERIWDENPIATVVIPANTHRLMYADIMRNEFGVDKDLYIEQAWLNSHWGFLTVALDFEVESGKNITLSTLAAYDKDYLNLTFDNGYITAGTINPVPVEGAPLILDDRENETDIGKKPKGVDNSTIDKVRGNLKYIIDDFVDDGELYINNKDAFYQTDVEEKLPKWIANLNALSAGYLDGWRSNFPSILPTYRYSDDNGDWVYGITDIWPNMPYDNRYMTTNTNQTNYTLTNDVINYYLNRVHDKPADLSSGMSIWEITNKEEIVVHGGYNVVHTYTIDIHNVGSPNNAPRTLKYEILFNGYLGAAYHVKDYNTGQPVSVKDADTGEELSYRGLTVESVNGHDFIDPYEPEDSRSYNKIFNLEIPAGAHYVITVSNMNNFGNSGYQNYLTLGTTH